MPHHSDLELARRVVAGDREAFDALYERLFLRTVAWVRRRQPDEGCVEAEVEDALADLLRALPRYRGDAPIEALVLRRLKAGATEPDVEPRYDPTVVSRSPQATAR